VALHGEWSTSSKDDFYTVEKTSGNALGMLGHRAQALWIIERSLTHQAIKP
jgi:hypothetical protein